MIAAIRPIRFAGTTHIKLGASTSASDDEKNEPQAPDLFSLKSLSTDDKNLQKLYPGHYAHLAPPVPFNRLGFSVSDTSNAIAKWKQHVPAKDREIASMSGTGLLMGSSLIATLATLGMNRRILGVPEFLGVMSWFAAMSITPKVIDGMVFLKTGVNMEQVYDTSYGERKNIFSDPHYLPLYLLPNRTVNQVAGRLGIPDDSPEKREQVEDKMRQISVQAHTWWMLVAGPASAVISGLLCDALQDRALGGINQIRKALIGKMSLRPQTPEQKSDAVLGCLVGHREEADLSMWWKAFSRQLIMKTQLHTNPRIKLPLPGRESLAQEITHHFVNLSNKRPQLHSLQQFLKDQRNDLANIKKEAEQSLITLEDGPEKEKRAAFVSGRLLNANSTLDQYEALFKSLQHVKTANPASPENIRLQMEHNLPALQALMQAGFRKEASRLAGGEKAFSEIAGAILSERNNYAAERLGASPMGHLIQSLQEVLLRSRWQGRMLLGLGGLVLTATTLYTSLFVGRDFADKSEVGA
jgi:hypothetical protein